MIHFTYRRTGAGWVVATRTNEPAETTAPASYVGDATRDFSVQSKVFSSGTAPIAFGSNRVGCDGNFSAMVRAWLGSSHGTTREQVSAGEDAWWRFSSKVGKELDHLLAPAAGSDT